MQEPCNLALTATINKYFVQMSDKLNSFLQAYNGFTSPASFTVVVRAVGPIRSDEVSLDERDFLR